MGCFEKVCEVLNLWVLQILVLKSYISMYLRYIVGIAYKKSCPYIEICAFYSEQKIKSFKI